MTREEAVERFNKYKEDLLKDNLASFWENIQKESERLQQVIYENLKRLKQQIERQDKRNIAHFQFSLLRVDLIERKYTVLLHAYNGAWYLDNTPLCIQFDISFLFESLDPLWSQLLTESKKYVGRVNSYDVNQAIYEEVFEMNKLIAHLLRFVLRDIEQEAFFKEMPLCDFWVMRWGEYRDKSEIILQVDREPKKEEDWKKAIDESNDIEDYLVCTYWYECDLKETYLDKKQLYFIGFEKCQLQDMHFADAALLGAKFKSCVIKNTYFEGACLKYSDFRGTHFENVDFTGADLTEATFSAKDVPYLHLSPEQLQVIQIERS